MASELYNVIDALSREKGINPDIVVSAVEDAIVVATRKYYKTQENLRAELDKETGRIRAYAVRAIVESAEMVEDPNAQITLDEARRIDPAAEVGGELRTEKPTEVLGRIGEAGHLPEGTRGRARYGLQRVHWPRRRDN